MQGILFKKRWDLSSGSLRRRGLVLNGLYEPGSAEAPEPIGSGPRNVQVLGCFFDRVPLATEVYDTRGVGVVAPEAFELISENPLNHVRLLVGDNILF